MIENILMWPNDDVVMSTGIETGIYGELPGREIGTAVEVRILHLDSGQYWRPEGRFGEEMTHTGVVVADDGHWRLMMVPPASGAYRLEVLETSSEGSLPLASTEFSVVGEDLTNPFASADQVNADELSTDFPITFVPVLKRPPGRSGRGVVESGFLLIHRANGSNRSGWNRL